MLFASRKSYVGARVGENMWGKGALKCTRPQYNKAGRGQETPQLEATKKTGPKIKAICNLWSVV